MGLSSTRIPPTPASFVRSKGFSLVEIAIALGILAFALLAILSLFTEGLRAEKDSYEDTKLADIVSTVASSLKSGQPTNSAGSWEFDYEGNSTDQPGAGAPYFSAAINFPSGVLNRPGLTNVRLVRIVVSYPAQTTSPRQRAFQLSMLTNAP